MINILIAFLAGGIVFFINMSGGYVADRNYLGIVFQPIIAILWCLGVRAAIVGFWPCFAYVVGSTLGIWGAIALRKHLHKVKHT